MTENKNTKNTFPYEIKNFDPEVVKKLKKEISEGFGNFVQVGPLRYACPPDYALQAETIYNMPLRPDDVVVASYPRSGTTWTQELVWMVANNFDYAGSAATPLTERYTFLESSTFFPPAAVESLRAHCGGDPARIAQLKNLVRPGAEVLAAQTSRRFIKTHLPLSLLPPGLPAAARVVYVARDPRDVAVSMFHFNRMISFINYQGDFATYWDVFKNGYDMYAPYFEHLKETWALREHPNVLFLFYEELQKDLEASIERVARFLGVECDAARAQALARHLHVDTFKANRSVNGSDMTEIGIFNESSTSSFVRKGGSKGWRGYFTAELAADAEAWVADNLRGTDLRFPDLDPQ